MSAGAMRKASLSSQSLRELARCRLNGRGDRVLSEVWAHSDATPYAAYKSYVSNANQEGRYDATRAEFLASQARRGSSSPIVSAWSSIMRGCIRSRSLINWSMLLRASSSETSGGPSTRGDTSSAGSSMALLSRGFTEVAYQLLYGAPMS